jgi:hypothetical protein
MVILNPALEQVWQRQYKPIVRIVMFSYAFFLAKSVTDTWPLEREEYP